MMVISEVLPLITRIIMLPTINRPNYQYVLGSLMYQLYYRSKLRRAPKIMFSTGKFEYQGF